MGAPPKLQTSHSTSQAQGWAARQSGARAPKGATGQPTRSSPQSKDGSWYKDAKEPQACLPCRHCTSVHQKRHFPEC